MLDRNGRLFEHILLRDCNQRLSLTHERTIGHKPGSPDYPSGFSGISVLRTLPYVRPFARPTRTLYQKSGAELQVVWPPSYPYALSPIPTSPDIHDGNPLPRRGPHLARRPLQRLRPRPRPHTRALHIPRLLPCARPPLKPRFLLPRLHNRHRRSRRLRQNSTHARALSRITR